MSRRFGFIVWNINICTPPVDKPFSVPGLLMKKRSHLVSGITFGVKMSSCRSWGSIKYSIYSNLDNKWAIITKTGVINSVGKTTENDLDYHLNNIFLFSAACSEVRRRVFSVGIIILLNLSSLLWLILWKPDRPLTEQGDYSALDFLTTAGMTTSWSFKS